MSLTIGDLEETEAAFNIILSKAMILFSPQITKCNRASRILPDNWSLGLVLGIINVH